MTACGLIRPTGLSNLQNYGTTGNGKLHRRQPGRLLFDRPNKIKILVASRAPANRGKNARREGVYGGT